MGIIAEYLMVDEETLDSLMDLDDEDLTDKIFEIQKFDRMHLDKIWDALHYFLTGVSTSTPIEGNKLSEAIVGVHSFNSDIACTDNKELTEIISAIEKINFDKIATDFDTNVLKKNKVYPEGIWEDSKEELLEEFKNSLDKILNFYKKALNTDHHIIVSIL